MAHSQFLHRGPVPSSSWLRQDINLFSECIMGTCWEHVVLRGIGHFLVGALGEPRRGAIQVNKGRHETDAVLDP